MANEEHLARLTKGVRAWNAWRNSRPRVLPDLAGAELNGRALSGVNFASVDLERTILTRATVTKANFEDANLGGADLSEAQLAGGIFLGANLVGATLNFADLRESDLRHTNFTRANLVKANISWSHLGSAKLVKALLTEASLTGADLFRANLSEANLAGANLSGAYLREASLRKADLRGTNFSRAVFTGTDFTDASIGHTVFGENDLSGIAGLESVRHMGPSVIGVDTVYLSKGNIPESFLRGCGVPEDFVAHMKSLTGTAIEFYSCFISYSTKDQDFAKRLHADLQSRNVRCWFAPHDVRGGEKLHEQVDAAIRVHDKLLLILSEASMNSEWVKTEIAKAREREVRDDRRVLFPIRLVPFETLRNWQCFDADTGKDSAREIREYYIPDFSDWKKHDSYQKALQHLIRDLKASG